MTTAPRWLIEEAKKAKKTYALEYETDEERGQALVFSHLDPENMRIGKGFSVHDAATGACLGTGPTLLRAEDAARLTLIQRAEDAE